MKTRLGRALVAVILAAGAARLVAQQSAPPSAADDLAFLQRAYAERARPDAQPWQERVEGRFADLSRDFEALITADQATRALPFAIPFAYFLSRANQQKRALDVLTRALNVPGARAPRAAARK